MDRDAELGAELSGRLTYLLKRALLTLEDLHAEHLAPFELNVRELAVLLFLDGREPESQQQAALHLGVDRTTMVDLLDDLEAKQFVVRQPDPADRRRNVVALTSRGRSTLVEATKASDEAERRLMLDLTEVDADQLRKLLSRVGASPSGSPTRRSQR